MKRKIFNFVTLISVVAGILVAVFWVRSIFASDHLRYFAPTYLSQYDQDAVIEGGTYAHETWCVFRIFPGSGPVTLSLNPGLRWNYYWDQFVPTPWQGWRGSEWFGFGLSVGKNPAYYQNLTGLMNPPAYYYGIKLPFWALLVLFSILPVLCYRRWAAGRVLIQRCNGCGYDLQGAVDTCPECGLAIPTEISKTQ